MLCLPSCLLLSHLVFSCLSVSPTLIPSSLLFIPLSQSPLSDSQTLCPCALNWSMETDSLKYLLWNLLHDDNSRPFPCRNWERSQTKLEIFRAGKEKNKPLKCFCNLWNVNYCHWWCHLFTLSIRQDIYEHVILESVHLCMVQMGCS